MRKQDMWRAFELSGKIEDYLMYKQQPKQTAVASSEADTGADQDKGNGAVPSEYRGK